MRLSKNGFEIVLKSVRRHDYWTKKSTELTDYGLDQWISIASKIAEPSKDWDDGNYADGFAPQTIKKFFALKNIKDETFLILCKAIEVNWQDVYEPGSERKSTFNSKLTKQELEALRPIPEKVWIGRKYQTDEIRKALAENTVVAIVGMSGIGKTALANKVIENLLNEPLNLKQVDKSDILKFNGATYLECDLEAEKTNSNLKIDFIFFIIKTLREWGQIVSTEEIKQPEELFRRFIYHFCQESHIIFIDAAEYLLAGKGGENWNDFKDRCWSNFFTSLTKIKNCKSRIILTSQDLPIQFNNTSKNLKHNNIFVMHLKGFNDDERLELFTAAGIEHKRDSSVQAEFLLRIGKLYEGHPFALWLTAVDIKLCSNGNAVSYWQENQKEFEELEKLRFQLDDHSNNDNLEMKLYISEKLKEAIQKKIQISITRLIIDNPDAFIVLLSGAGLRRSETKDVWFKYLDILDNKRFTEEKCYEYILILLERHLVEIDPKRKTKIPSKILFREHNLIRAAVSKPLQNAFQKTKKRRENYEIKYKDFRSILSGNSQDFPKLN